MLQEDIGKGSADMGGHPCLENKQKLAEHFDALSCLQSFSLLLCWLDGLISLVQGGVFIST